MEIRMRKALLAATILVFCAACSENETRNGVGGALLGAGAGAIIGNNVGHGHGNGATGAIVGAAVGAAAGAYAGCVQDGRCGGDVDHHQYRDERSSRYYFRDPKSGQYYYDDGTPYP
jgi:uncharacterized protein YcfJ